MRHGPSFTFLLALASLVAVGACKRGPNTPVLQRAAETWPNLSEPPPPAPVPALRDAAVIVAIEDYSYVDDIPGARANAADWVQFLAKTQGIPERHIHLLWNFEATKEKILEYAERAASQVSPGGRLWFVFIGHGAPAQGNDDAWLVGFDAQRSPDSISARSVSQRELVSILERPQGVTPIVVLDACFNGRTSAGDRLMEAGLQDLMFVDLASGSHAVVLSASRKDEYAGSLPGLNRPAFTYLLLGAMRGWGDANRDGQVTAAEAVDYSRTVLATLLKQRSQTPEIVDDRGGEIPMAVAGDEVGPDLTEMRLRGAGATELVIHGETMHVPDASLLQVDTTDIRDINIRAEQLYGEAMKVQQDALALPEEKASAWCALARERDASNPYRLQALTMCREWQVFARALRDKETAMASDYETLRQYFALEHKTSDQKLAAAAAFMSGYADLTAEDYPHIREVERARKKLARGQSPTMPSLAGVELVPAGSPSSSTPQEAAN